MQKISVVTVCYNAVKDIEKTLLSVINQTYKNIEYIIVDGGSTDGTVNLLEKYVDYISKWISEPDNGIYNAMNKGALLATGDYIQFLNAGDTLYDSSVFENLFTDKLYDVGIIYGDMIMECKEGAYYGKPRSLATFKRDFPLFHPSVFVRQDLMKMHLFDENYKISADYKLLRDLYYHGEVFSYVSIPIVRFDGVNGVSSNSPYAIFKERGKIFGIDKGVKWIISCYVFKLKFLLKSMIKKVVPEKYFKKEHTKNMLLLGMKKID